MDHPHGFGEKYTFVHTLALGASTSPRNRGDELVCIRTPINVGSLGLVANGASSTVSSSAVAGFYTACGPRLTK